MNPQYYNNLTTTNDIHQLEASIDLMLEKLFKTRGEFGEKIDACFSDVQKELVMNVFTQEQIDTNDAVVVKRTLEQIKLDMIELPQISMAVAVELPYNLMQKIAQWLYVQFNKKIILDIRVESALLGGVALFQQGRYKDYSLQKRLSDMAERGQLKITEVVG